MRIGRLEIVILDRDGEPVHWYWRAWWHRVLVRLRLRKPLPPGKPVLVDLTYALKRIYKADGIENIVTRKRIF